MLSVLQSFELHLQTHITITIDVTCGCHMLVGHEVCWDLAFGPVGCENFLRNGGLDNRGNYLSHKHCPLETMKSASHSAQEV